MTNASSLTFQKILPLKKVTIAGLICCCPASVPTPSLFYPKWDSKEKNWAFSLHYNNTRFSPSTERLVQKWFQLEYNKYISTYKYTKQVRSPHPLHKLPDFFFLFVVFLFLFFFLNTAQHGNFFWITCSKLEHQINFRWKHGYLKKMGMDLCLLTACEETIT